jgi:hypothetical protein
MNKNNPRKIYQKEAIPVPIYPLFPMLKADSS